MAFALGGTFAEGGISLSHVLRVAFQSMQQQHKRLPRAQYTTAYTTLVQLRTVNIRIISDGVIQKKAFRYQTIVYMHAKTCHLNSYAYYICQN